MSGGAVVSAALILSLGCGQPNAGNPEVADLKARIQALEAKESGSGRYQVVNGVPSMARSVTLLDTKTGKTWLMCTMKDTGAIVETSWCAMKSHGVSDEPR